MKIILVIGLILAAILMVSCTQETDDVVVPGVPVSTIEPSLRWIPTLGMRWQWQLVDTVDTSIPAEVYDIDLYEDQHVIDQLQARSVKVICYMSVGSWEDWRPDAEDFPNRILGNRYVGWPGELWLDIRQIDLLAPIMRARLDLCAAKGFDGVEPDNIDLYQEATGFPISYQDQLAYARWLAEEAHVRGLAIGLKNAPEMVTDAIPYFDFAITEDAFQDGWIDQMFPFIASGKPVFDAEYLDSLIEFPRICAVGARDQVSTIFKTRELTAFRVACP